MSNLRKQIVICRHHGVGDLEKKSRQQKRRLRFVGFGLKKNEIREQLLHDIILMSELREEDPIKCYIDFIFISYYITSILYLF